jgi:hypothetical protein
MKTDLHKFTLVLLSVFLGINVYGKNVYLSSDEAIASDDDGYGLAVDKPVATLTRALALANENDDFIFVSGIMDISKEAVSGESNFKGITPTDKGLTFIGENRETCGFDGNNASTIFRLDGLGRQITFTNLTFKNGDSKGKDTGSGLYIRNSKALFENCLFLDNVCSATNNGGAIFFFSPNDINRDITFNNCEFKGNKAREGSAIYATGGKITITGCSFIDNGYGDGEISGWNYSKGGAIYYNNDTERGLILNVENSLFKGNKAQQYGGVAYFLDNNKNNSAEINIQFIGCLITGNSCSADNGNGGAFIINQSSANVTMNVSIINSTIYDNTANNQGSALHIENIKGTSTLNLINATIAGNKSVKAGGNAGIRFSNNSALLIKKIYNTIIEGNASADQQIDINFQGNLPGHFNVEEGTRNIFLANSFIGRLGYDTGLYDEKNDPVDCSIGYDYTDADNNAGLDIANAADDIAACGAILLKADASAIDFGNSAFLSENNITTDQLGNKRYFTADKCDAGAVETAKMKLDAANGANYIFSGTWKADFIDSNYADATSIDWVNVADLPSEKPAAIVNPNCLFYVSETAPADLKGLDNVVVKAANAETFSAKNIVLTDGYDFNNTTSFTAESASYTRTYPDAGWVSLCLPYSTDILQDMDVQEYKGASGSTVSFQKAISVIAANTPYLIKIETDDTTISYTGTNIQIPATALNDVSGDGDDYTFKGTFSTIEDENVTGLYLIQLDGSNFVKVTDESIPAFQAYIQGDDPDSPAQLAVIFDGQTSLNRSITESNGLSIWSENGILYIKAAIEQTINIFSIDGRLALSVYLNEGMNVISNLSKGMYVSSNKKVIIK